MDLFQMNQSAVSHQLKVLENAGLVEGASGLTMRQEEKV